MIEILAFIVLPLIVIITVTCLAYPENYCIGLGVGTGFLTFLGVIIFALPWSFLTTSWETAQIDRSIPAEELNFITLPNGEIQVWNRQELIKHAVSAKECFKINSDSVLKVEFRSQQVFGPDYKCKKIIYKDGTTD